MKEQIEKIIKAEMERHNEATLHEAYAKEIGREDVAREYHSKALEIYRFVTELENLIGEVHLYNEVTTEYRGYELKHHVLIEW